VIDADEYCREIEAYLCRKNDGHLVRLVGPAFERVRSWAVQGIPARVTCAGIDRYFERYYRRGPRRRPVRIEFCEADVLDAFDDWRRAVGVAASAATGTDEAEAEDATTAPRRKGSLPGHLEEAIARLTALRGSTRGGGLSTEQLESIVRALDHLLAESRHVRGGARDALLEQLSALDGQLMDAASGLLTDADQAEIAADVDQELAPFKPRMTAEAHAAARDAASKRLVRERFALPKVAFE
jgi:hypothetical protein